MFNTYFAPSYFARRYFPGPSGEIVIEVESTEVIATYASETEVIATFSVETEVVATFMESD